MAGQDRRSTMLQPEQVYERILSRVDRDELRDKCHGVTQRDADGVQRRICSAQRVLQHAYDVEAARKTLPVSSPPQPASVATTALLTELKKLQSKINSKMRELSVIVSGEQTVSREADKSTSEVSQAKPLSTPAPEPRSIRDERDVESSPAKSKKRRRPRQESIDSPRKPPRPGRLAIADGDVTEEEEDEAFPKRGGPHEMPRPTDDDETEDELPMELDVLDSDTEVEMASYLEKARRLRKISSERRMGELPGLIEAVLIELDRHEWATMPRELLGTLSATLGAATTLQPPQRRQLQAELLSLRAVALVIDEITARRYPTLLGSKARFLSSMEDLSEHAAQATPALSIQPTEDDDVTATTDEDTKSLPIERLLAATTGLAQRTDVGDEPRSMEQIDGVLTLVDHVFDNPTLARSDRYRAKVGASLDVLVAYVDAVSRTTRRKLQSLELLQRRRAQLTGLEV